MKFQLHKKYIKVTMFYHVSKTVEVIMKLHIKMYEVLHKWVKILHLI